jgi:hypothetical protein
MGQSEEYCSYIAMLEPIVGRQGMHAMLAGRLPETNDRRAYRTVLFYILWRDARDKPARLDESFFGLFPERMRIKRRLGEGLAHSMARQRENFNKVRRTINCDLTGASVPAYIELIYGSPKSRSSRTVVNEVQLVLDPAKVQMLRERDALHTVRGSKKVVLSVTDGKRRLRIGDDLSLTLVSSIRGWLTLFVFDPRGVNRIVPDEEDPRDIAIEPRRIYSLPRDIMRSVRWTLNNAPGLHTFIAVVTREREVILPHHGSEVRARLHRGVTRSPVSIWTLPRKDLAVGCCDVNVLPARHRSD